MQNFRFNSAEGNLPEPHQMADFQQMVDQTPDDEVKTLSQEYVNQMPKAQQMSLFSGLMGALGNHSGFDPRQAGISTTDPNKASSLDLGNLAGYAMNSGLLGGLLGGGGSQGNQAQGGLGGALGGLLGGNHQSQQPQQPQYDNRQGSQYAQPGSQAGGGLQSLLGNPMARAALGGLIAYGAGKFMDRMQQNRGGQSQQQPQYQQPQPQQQPQYNNNSNQSNQMYSQTQNQTQDNGITDLGGGGSALPGFENPR